MRYLLSVEILGHPGHDGVKCFSKTIGHLVILEVVSPLMQKASLVLPFVWES